MILPTRGCGPHKEALAFLLGVWSADGYIGIYPKYRIYRFGIIMSADELDLIEVYQDIARGLGFQFKPPRYINRKRTGVALEINSKAVVEMLLKAGAVIGKKTKVNPSIPQWIKEKTEYIKNWFRGVILGDGNVRVNKQYIEWSRTLKIPKHYIVWRKLVDLITTHPRAQYSPYMNSLKLSQSYIPTDISAIIKQHYIPKMFQEEIKILESLDIFVNICYRVSYYEKTRNVTVTWRGYLWNEDAIKLAKFLRFSKTPWHAKKVLKLRQLENFKI